MVSRLPIISLRPNNWFLNQSKVEAIRLVWELGHQDRLPPISVTKIDGDWCIIDGHTRAYVAFERHAESVPVDLLPIDPESAEGRIYYFIHRNGPAEGIHSVLDLGSRILPPAEYQKKWIRFCSNLSSENLANLQGVAE